MSYNTQPTLGRRIGRSILWILSTALITFVLIVVIGLIIWGAFLGFEELRRSFSAIDTRNAIHEQKIGLLRSDVDNLMADSRRVNSLQSEVSDLEARLARLQQALADLRQQQERLVMLEEDTAMALSASERVAQDAAALSAGLNALQEDITGSSQRIDELGGELDQLRAEVSTLNSGFTDLQVVATAQAGDEITETREVLTLFRVWELISRARLRLLEDNFGLARADTEQALRTMDVLVATAPEQAETWQRIQTRLELALVSLPGDPAMAAGDLESAWDALDEVLTATLLPELETAEPLPEDSDESAAVEEATVEPTATVATPTAAASPTPTSEATPAVTASPTPTVEPTAVATVSPTPTP